MPPPKLFLNLSLNLPTEDMLTKKSLEALKEFGLNEEDYEKIKDDDRLTFHRTYQ